MLHTCACLPIGTHLGCSGKKKQGKRQVLVSLSHGVKLPGNNGIGTSAGGGARNRCTPPKSGMTFDNHSLRLHPEHCDEGAATYPLNTSRANISMSVRADARAPSLGPVAEVNTVMFRSGNSVTRLWCPIESPPWLTHQ